MANTFSLKCSASDAELTLEKRNQDRWNITFHGKGFSGKVDAYDDNWKNLATFFEDISTSWSELKKPKTWGSLEDHLQLSAIADKLGHITLNIEVHNHDGITAWSTTGAIVLESGNLNQIASAAKKAFL